MKAELRSILHRLSIIWTVVAITVTGVACTDGAISGLPQSATPIAANTIISSTPTLPATYTPQDAANAGGTPTQAEPTSEPERSETNTQVEQPTERLSEDVPEPTAIPTTQPGTSVAVLLGAGDIAGCDHDEDVMTARLLDGMAGTVFTLGDNVYDDGTASEFRECYEPTWGRHKSRTRPAPGNHDYRTDDGAPYYDYFGEAAGEPRKGWYSYDLGAWHVVVLNSNCDDVGGCGSDSEQVRWLRADLAAHPAPCALSYWHHPRFSAGNYDDDDELRPFWQALYDGGAEIVMVGHDHNYQRYAPQDPNGDADSAPGIRQFVVGTGGRGLYDIEREHNNLEASNDNSHGVLKLSLSPLSYTWEFIPIEGDSFTDSGSGSCH